MIRARAGEGRGSVAKDRRQQISVAPCCERVQREPDDVHDQERNPENDTVTVESLGDGQRGDEHRRHRDQHRAPYRVLTGIDGVGQPGVGGPRPPERGKDQETVPEPTPRRIIRQDRRDLCEPEDEDEVEEELERSDALLALNVLLAHSRTLARTVRDREFTRPLLVTSSGVCARPGPRSRPNLTRALKCVSVATSAVVRVQSGERDDRCGAICGWR
jgi:hypothetical protein